MKEKDIKSNVLRQWDHPNCKFRPGDTVKVSRAERNSQKKYLSRAGEVVAVTCTKNGTIRDYKRQYTRYYVDFGNDDVHYFESHYLKKA
jgi:hypothetical protein